MLLKERKSGLDEKTIINDLPDQGSSSFCSEFKINPLESDFYRPTPLPSVISWASDPLPHPLGISKSLHGGGMDIFWNHTIIKVLVECYCPHQIPASE